jgi:hypothetical protein
MTNGAYLRNKAKSGGDGGSRKRRTLPVGEPRRRLERAKQSQYRSEVSSLKCEVSSSVLPPGVIPAGGGWATWLLTRRAEQSQFEAGALDCGARSAD